MNGVLVKLKLKDRTVRGHYCPRPEVPITVRTRQEGGSVQYLSFPFIIDTGSDVTLVPFSMAKEYFIPFEDTVDVDETSNRNFGASLKGYWGQISIYFRAEAPDPPATLPCFFYLSPASGSKMKEVPLSHGEPGRQQVRQPATDVEDWQTRQLGKQQPEDSTQPLFILGRAGFLAMYALSIQNGEVIISLRQAGL